jgi:hypothetical protein
MHTALEIGGASLGASRWSGQSHRLASLADLKLSGELLHLDI